MRHLPLFSGASLGAIPNEATAHAAERGLILLLPTEYYLVGGAVAVALTFAGLASLSGRMAWLSQSIEVAVPRALGTGLPWLGFAGFCGLVIAGFWGARDPLANPLPLAVWTVIWIAMAALVALVGDVWSSINPWTAPARAIRRVIAAPSTAPPVWLGFWPAIAGLSAIVWFQIADIAPEDPARLAQAVCIYWAVHLVGAVWYGEAWLARCEALSVFFSMLGRIAPLQLGASIHLSWPGGRVVDRQALPVSGWLFVTMAIAAVTFDGLAGTFWWLGLNGVNPLEHPGRSAVWGMNTLGLVGTWVLMSAAYAAAIAVGWILADRSAPLCASLGRAALSLLPIALAYHLSHYLTALLVNGQYVALAITDPLGTGADWLGLGSFPVTTSFLNNLDDVRVIWWVQTGLIVGGHVMAVILAHAIAVRLYPDRRAAIRSQAPLSVLMIAYTALGLWLLSTPTAI